MVCLVVATFPGRGPAGVYQQRLYCHGILPIMRCAFGVHLDVGLAEQQTPCRVVETVRHFLPSFQGRWPSFDKTEPQ